MIEEIFPNWHAYYAIKALKNHRLLIAVNEKGKIIGFIEYKIVCSNSVKIGHIYYMGVKNEYRGHGVGTKLVLEAERELINNSVDCIIAATQEDNEPVIRIFTKLGYLVTNWRTAYKIIKKLGAEIEDEYDLMWLIYDYDKIVLIKVLKKIRY